MVRSGLVVALVFLSAIGAVQAEDRDAGYLFPGANLHIQTWLPKQPPRNSFAQAADVEEILETRALLTTARGDAARADDAYLPREVAPRFSAVLGATLDDKSAPHLMHLMQLVTNDARWLMEPIKKSVDEGGRQRPFVDYPTLQKCPIAYATLAQTGSYPSGHAALGWLWGSILAEIVPDQADALLARGIDFGDSRVVCGFHYPSDVIAGRLAAAALLDRLHTNKRFNHDVDEVRTEVTRLLRKRN